MGFPSTVLQCSSCASREQGNRATTRIIPDMNFTCSGTVTHWRAAGEFRPYGNADTNSMLSIWRKRSSEPGTYDRIDGIELGICGGEDPAPLVVGMSNVYNCTLPPNERVSVQPGDIVGIELPRRNRARFQPYFDDTNNGPTSYVFYHSENSLPSVNLIQYDIIDIAQPQVQITLTVERTAEIVPTTQPLVTTSPATAVTYVHTMEALTTQDSAPTTDLPGTTQNIATTQSTTISSDYTEPMVTDKISNSTKEGTTTIPNIATSIMPEEIRLNNSSSVGVVVGLVVGMVSLLSTVAILIVVVAYQSRKYKRDMRERETRIDKAQNVNMVDIETRPNDSYIPTFHQILTEANAAYGYGGNRDSDGGYLTITSDSMKGNAQESVTEQNEENHYEFID